MSKQSNHQKIREDSTLEKASFKPVEGDLLWEKNGVLYGREAALQRAWQKLRNEEGEDDTSDQT